jgi:hypothetical protein
MGKFFIDEEGELDGNEWYQEIDLYLAVRKLLSPYTPAATEKEADKYFTTQEIISAIEQHYGISQSDPEAQLINGVELVNVLEELNYRSANISGLEMQWLMKRK